MATKQPLSSISYNTKDFLVSTLEHLRYMQIISYYEFIEHQPDVDGTKKHIHLICFPCKGVNPETFRQYFVEKIADSENPLQCMPFRTSNYGDWYWYALHDKDYLKSKQMERNCFYKDDDVFSPMRDFHEQLVSEHPLINYCKLSDMLIRDIVFKSVQNGISLNDILKNNMIPLGKTQSVIHLYNAISPSFKPPPERIIPHPKQLRMTKLHQTINKILHGDMKSEDEDELF